MTLVRARREALLAADARTDFLSGVLNRRGFTQKAEERLLKGPCYLLLLDIDYFKSVNDQLGNGEDDALLRHLGRVCSQAVPGSGLVGQLGGDEFVVLIQGNADEGVALAKRINEAVRAASVARGMSVSVSVGTTGAVGGAHRLEELFAEADRDLYLAKGRRLVVR